MEAAAPRFWIFQSHPERYDVAERLVAGRTDNWVVSAFAEEMRPGDVVYLWRAGSEDALYGWAEVTTEVFEAEPGRIAQSRAVEAPAEEAPQLRVELAYRVRFEPPLTREEIRSHPELEKLAPLHTGSGTNFPVAPHEAAALDELVRRRGFEAPPGLVLPPPPEEASPQEAPPEPADPVRWERLSQAAQGALGWAVASERPNPRVGTRGMLIGLVRLSDLETEPVQLLQYLGRTQDELFEALQSVRPQPVIDPNVAEPVQLTDLPPLTPNGRRAFELAFELQSDPAAPVDVRHLFGGLLGVEVSRAYEALGRVLGDQIPIARISQTYGEYLARDAGTYRAFLDDVLAPRDRVDWIADTVARRDLLGRRKLAEVVATRLRQLREVDPDASFLIHVDGPWGSGKSTLLDFLAEELEAGGDKWLVVRYDAWRETRVGPPWWTLLVQLREKLARSRGWWGRVSLWVTEAWPRFRAAWLLYLLVLALAIVLFVVIGTDQTMAYITALSALFAGAAAVSRFFLWDSARGARVYESVQKNPMEGLSRHFAWLIERSPLPVVFLVDELDRCSDAQVVDLLDSIQTMIRDAPRKRGETSTAPYFVIAADGAWIRRSYELAHERMAVAVAEPGRPLGYLFLAKIFQLTVKMPSLSPELRTDYLQTLLRRGEPAPEKREAGEERAAAEKLRESLESSTREDQVLDVLGQATPAARQDLAALALDLLNARDVERETEAHVLDKFGALVEPNPRAIKRLVIAYGIERSVRTLEGSVVPRDTLVLWTILNTRWPGLGDYLTERPEAVEDLEAGVVPPETPPELQPLFRSDAVKEVVEFSQGGPLTKEDVAECSGVRLDLPRRPRSSRHETAS
jgi:hypothetical protein